MAVARAHGLTSQIRRAAVSSAVNLAEGVARLGRKECARFVDIAHGSLAEVQCLLRFGRDLGYLDEETWLVASNASARAGARVWGLLRALRREVTDAATGRPPSRRSPPSPPSPYTGGVSA